MRFSSFSVKLILSLFLLLSIAVIAYAAAPISNPLCTLQQVSNLPFNPYWMTSISGDGNRAIAGGWDTGSESHIWNLTSNTQVGTLPDAAYPVMDYDGSRIAFYSNNNLTGQNSDGNYELFLWDTGTSTQLTSAADGANMGIPDISADGMKIVFASSLDDEMRFYIWLQGLGLQYLVQATSTSLSPNPVRIGAEGNYAVFLHDGNLTGQDPQNKGAFYRIDLSTNIVSHLLTIDAKTYPQEFFVVDGDASRIAFSSSENFNNLNPNHHWVLWILDTATGIRMLSNGSGTPSYPYHTVLGFSDDGNRLLFGSTYNPTGENPDGSYEYFSYEWGSNSIRQLSSKTGFPFPLPNLESLSASGQRAIFLLPPAADYPADDLDTWNAELELFKANCSPIPGQVAAPTNLRTTTITGSSIRLAWNDNASNESSYLVERSLDGQTWTQVASLSSNITGYIDSALSCGTNYSYRVRAYRSTGNLYSSYSDTLTTSTTLCSLGVPSNLRSTSVGSRSVALAWNDNSSAETNFLLEHRLTSGEWTQIATINANTTSYTDTNASCGENNEYRIRVYNSSSNAYSEYSSTLSVMTLSCVVAAPTNLVKTGMGLGTITIAWQDNATDENAYSVERSVNGTSWAQIATLNANITSYTNSSLNCSANYQYRVRAKRNIDNLYSDYSNILIANCMPAAATNVQGGTIRSNNILVTWTDNASNETFYVVYYSSDGTNWYSSGSLAQNTTSRLIKDLACDTSYFIKVSAYAYNGATPTESDTVTIKTRPCSLAVPSDFAVTSMNLSSFTLTWTDTTEDETVFYLEYNPGSAWVELATIPAGTQSYTKTGLNCSDRWTVRLRVYRASDDNYSDYTSEYHAYNQLCTPNLGFAQTGSSHILLSWGIYETSYIERSLDGINWAEVGTVDSNTYLDSALLCETSYKYRVRNYRSEDNSYSNYSNTLTATTLSCILPAPSNLRITAADYTTIRLAWNDNSSDETSFELESSLDGSTWDNVASLFDNTTANVHSPTLCNTAYFFRIRAIRDVSDSFSVDYSDYSNVITGQTTGCLPAAPSNLGITGNTSTSISLIWTDNASDETSYLLYANGILVATAAANTTSFTITGLPCGQSYSWLAVRAYRESDNSYSDYATNNNPAARTDYCPPSHLRIISSTPTSATLTWKHNLSFNTRYRLEYRENGGQNWAYLGTEFSYDPISFTHTGVTCDIEYEYRVRADYSGIETENSNIAVFLSPCDFPPPSNLAMSSRTPTSITLSWTDNSSDESHFILEHSLDGLTWTESPSISANSKSYTVANLLCSVDYQFHLRAYRSSDDTYSVYSDIVSIKTATCPALVAPTNLRTTGATGDSVTLAWNDNDTTETGFQLERALNGGNEWIGIAVLPANTTSYTNTGLSCLNSYRYRVLSYRSTGVIDNSPDSSIISSNPTGCPPPLAPSSLSLGTVSFNSISMTWIGVTYPYHVNYRLERSISGSNSWTEVATISSNLISHNNTGLACNTSYQYRMRTYRSGYDFYSGYSNVLTASTSACPPPSTPTALTLSQITLNRINLTWADNANNETGYRVERTLDNGLTWTEIAQLAGNSTGYSNTGLSCQTNYGYRVRAYRATDNSFSYYSNLASAATSSCPIYTPNNPQVSSAQFSLSLAWVDSASYETDFELQQNNGTWQTIASLPANSTSFTVTNLLCYTNYSFRVRAYNSASGVYSAWLELAGSTSACPPLVASSLSSTSAQNSINLSWTVDNTAQSSSLSYSDGLQWHSLGSFNKNTTSFNHSGLACGQSYQYRLETQRPQDNASVVSNTVSTATLICPPLAVPAAPTLLNASTSLVTLQIPAMPSGATSMSLERSLDGITWASIGLASGSYSDVTVSCGMSFYYRLVAYRASDGQYSPASPSVQATTQACPVYVSQIVGVYRAGTWSFVDSNATAAPTSLFSFGDATWQPLVGDWDGDGVDGIGLYHNGEFILRSIVAGQVQESRFSFGTLESGWQPLVGDWNGDGIDSIGLYKDGVFILSDDNITMTYRFNLGDGANWKAVAGDWDGNGTDGVALYQNGLWLLVDSAVNPVIQMISFGPASEGWLPIVGDWDGNGTDTIGLYQNGLWRIRQTSNTGGAEISIVYGTAGDIPLSTYEGGIPSPDLSQSPAGFVQPTIVPEATAESE
jgi:hypothetical protein